MVSNRIQFTVNVEDVGLDDVLVTLSVTRVVAGVDEAHVADVEGAIGEHFELVVGAQLRQVEPVTPPNDRRTGRSGHVALDFNVVAHSATELVHFQSFVQ